MGSDLPALKDMGAQGGDRGFDFLASSLSSFGACVRGRCRPCHSPWEGRGHSTAGDGLWHMASTTGMLTGQWPESVPPRPAGSLLMLWVLCGLPGPDMILFYLCS